VAIDISNKIQNYKPDVNQAFASIYRTSILFFLEINKNVVILFCKNAETYKHLRASSICHHSFTTPLLLYFHSYPITNPKQIIIHLNQKQ